MKPNFACLFATVATMGFATAALAQDAAATMAKELGGELPDKQGVTFDTVLATVNGTEITAGQLMLMRTELPQQFQQMPADTLFNQLLEQAISQQLFSEAMPGTTDLIEAALLVKERQWRAAVQLDTEAKAAVTEEAIDALYQELHNSAEEGREFHAAHILVPSEEEAQEVITALLAGNDFATMAQQRSTGPSGPNGGDLGWFSEGMMVAPFENAVKAMEPGEISTPVETQFGWHVILLKDTRVSSAPSLDEVRPQLVQELQNRAIQARLGTLQDTGDVTRKTILELDSSFLNDPDFLTQ